MIAGHYLIKTYSASTRTDLSRYLRIPPRKEAPSTGFRDSVGSRSEASRVIPTYINRSRSHKRPGRTDFKFKLTAPDTRSNAPARRDEDRVIRPLVRFVDASSVSFASA